MLYPVRADMKGFCSFMIPYFVGWFDRPEYAVNTAAIDNDNSPFKSFLEGCKSMMSSDDKDNVQFYSFHHTRLKIFYTD